MRRTTIALLLVLLACGGGGGKASPKTTPTKQVVSSKTFTDAKLSTFVLAAADLGSKSALKRTAAESLTIEKFWGCCPKQRTAFEQASYSTGYRSAFTRTLPADVASWPSGIAFANSAVALFADAAGASKALPVWQGFFEASAVGKPAKVSPGIGDESSGLDGIFFKNDQQIIIWFWRVGNAIFHLRIGARTGTITGADIKRLAAKIQARAEKA